MRLTLKEVIEATGGFLLGIHSHSMRISGVSTDSRCLRSGDLFVALKGPHYDGHHYLEAAIKKGASVLVVQKKGLASISKRQPVILVADTLQALGDLAGYWRRQFSIPVIAVTGSNGKTTTKDMIAALLSQKYSVLKTEGNFNNLIGLPLTLFRLNQKHQCAVVECGISRKGEMARLVKIAQPQIGVVTNIGRAHLEGFGSMKAVAQEKGILYSHLPREGQAVIQDSSPYKKLWKSKTRCHFSSFGCHVRASIYGKDIRADDKGGNFLTVVTSRRSFPIYVPIPGQGNVENALAAIAATHSFGLSATQIQRAFRAFETTGHRSRILTLKNQLRLIDDCYNANPDSMKQAIALLAQLGNEMPTVAILGNMFELGKSSRQEHRALGRYIAQRGIKTLIAVGSLGKDIQRGAVKHGFSKRQAFHFDQATSVLENRGAWLPRKGLILVKASRGMRFERIVEGLLKLKKEKGL